MVRLYSLFRSLGLFERKILGVASVEGMCSSASALIVFVRISGLVVNRPLIYIMYIVKVLYDYIIISFYYYVIGRFSKRLSKTIDWQCFSANLKIVKMYCRISFLGIFVIRFN